MQTVAGTTSYGGYLGSTNSVTVQMWADQTGSGTMGTRTNHPLLLTTNNTERARIDSSGNMGIATSTVSTIRLRIASAQDWIIIGRNSANNADVFGVANSGNVQNSNNSYGAFSDIKLKENVTDATPKLEKLQQVRVVNYNLIGETQKQIGVIAQELEQIFPGMVEETADKDAEGNDLGTTTKSVKYSVFVPMLIKAIQEQQAIINQLKARLDAANL
jgi:hypothetical protein